MKLAVAELWAFLTEVVLLASMVFALLHVFAPAQDLFWTPLDLNLPIGAATMAKVADFEVRRDDAPEVVEAVTAACMDALTAAGIEVQRAPDRDDGGFCVVQGGVRLKGGDMIPLVPEGLVMQCPLAVRHILWDRHVLSPAARQIRGSDLVSIDSMGSYACRRIYGSTDVLQRPSEHARANALDISAFGFKDGSRVSVAADWEGLGPAGRSGADFLRAARDGACRLFSTVLTPDYNDAHRDHLHLDGASYRLCARGPARSGPS